jgi:hypothetical protein
VKSAHASKKEEKTRIASRDGVASFHDQPEHCHSQDQY